jgi:hypothetical protein
MSCIKIKESELPGSLKCIRNSKASGLKHPYSFSNHVQSDNDDYLCASGSLFAICTCPPISKCVYFSLSTPWYNIIFQWPFWRVSVRPWEACLVWQHLIYNILVGLSFPKKLHIKPATYICVMRGKGIKYIGLRDKMRWEFMRNMQGDLNLWTWFSSFSSSSLFSKFLRSI